MNCIKDAASPGEGDEWPGWAIGNVDDDLGITEVDLFKIQATASILRDSDIIWVERLFACHFVEINVELAYGIDDRGQVVDFWRRNFGI